MTESLTLYHGTSSVLARYLANGCNESPLEQLGVHDLAMSLYDQMVELKGAETGAWTLFEKVPDLKDHFWGSEVVSGLRNAGRGNATKESLVTYGSLYGSISFLLAAHYATKSPFGSELLHFVHGAMVALQHAGAKLPILDNSISQLLAAAHKPAVVVLKNVPLKLLLREDGRGEYSIQNLRDYRKLVELAGESSAGAAGTVRIQGSIVEYLSSIRLLDGKVEYPGHSEPISYQEITVNEFLEGMT